MKAFAGFHYPGVLQSSRSYAHGRNDVCGILSPRSGIGHTETHLMPGFMLTLTIVLALLMPPPEWRTDDCWYKLFRRLDEIRVRVDRGGWTEQQRLDATRLALLAYMECRGMKNTSPNPNPD